MLSASLKYAGLDAENNQECPAIVQRWVIDESDWMIDCVETSVAIEGSRVGDVIISRTVSPGFCEKTR
ncbi:MAG TPA: hypothetical protein VGC39_11290 [Candidatus Methylacidiphilales bacterium]